MEFIILIIHKTSFFLKETYLSHSLCRRRHRWKHLIIRGLYNPPTSAHVALNLVGCGGHIGVSARLYRESGRVRPRFSLGGNRLSTMHAGYWVGGWCYRVVRGCCRGKRRAAPRRREGEGREKEEVEKVPPSDPLSSRLPEASVECRGVC